MQELLEAEAANVKPIEDEIEDERRKVEAKTPITEEVSCSSIVLARPQPLQGVPADFACREC